MRGTCQWCGGETEEWREPSLFNRDATIHRKRCLRCNWTWDSTPTRDLTDGA